MSVCMEEKTYLEQKVDVLYDIGMSDKHAIREYLKSETKNDISEEARENHIDRLARDMMMNYYDGDVSFVKTNKTKARSYYEKLKRHCAGMETVYEDVIISIVGEFGLNALRKAHMIETCACFNGRKLYAI